MKYIMLFLAIIVISSLMGVDGWYLNPFKRGKKVAATEAKRDKAEDDITLEVSKANEKLAVGSSEVLSTLKPYSYDYDALTTEDEDGTLFGFAEEEFNDSSFEDDSDFMTATYSYSFGTSKDPVAKSTAPTITELSIVIETTAKLLVGDSDHFANNLETPRGAHRLEESFTDALKQLLRDSKLPFAVSFEEEGEEFGLHATLTSFTHTSDSQFEVQMSTHLISRKTGGGVATKMLNQRAKLIELAVRSGQLIMFFDNEDISTRVAEEDGFYEEDEAFDTEEDYERGLRFIVQEASFLTAQKLKIEYNYDDWEKKVQKMKVMSPDSKLRRTEEVFSLPDSTSSHGSYSTSSHGSYEGGDSIILEGFGSYDSDSFSYPDSSVSLSTSNEDDGSYSYSYSTSMKPDYSVKDSFSYPDSSVSLSTSYEDDGSYSYSMSMSTKPDYSVKDSFSYPDSSVSLSTSYEDDGSYSYSYS
ncbi:hypothetical protein TrCOL_g4686, partial [Triparma columacea]